MSEANGVATTMTWARSGARGGAFRTDWTTVTLVLAISLLGLIMVTSASVSIANKESGEPFMYLERQLLLLCIGGAAAFVLTRVRTELLEKLALPLLVAALALLVAVLIPGLGHVVNGSRRWIRLAGFNFQASELARLLVLIFIASYAARREAELRTRLAGLAKPLGLLALAAVLLLAEPDFGAATVLFATGFGVLFVAGARLRYVIAMMLTALAIFGALVALSGYRMRRLGAFLDPWADPFNSGFQLTQSLIAIGRGEWFGVGLGESVQKLFYLPEAYTDFIFAIIGEELGLLGTTAILCAFLLLAGTGLRVARESRDPFPSLLAVGLTVLIAFQAFIIMGGVTRLLPLTGVTLPFVSYGGSSLVANYVLLALLVRISDQTARRAPERAVAM